MNIVDMLSAEEFNVLNKIAQKTKMDCWFDIRQKFGVVDIVYDLENDTELSLKDGVSQLMEGLDCQENFDSCSLDCSEKTILKGLLEKLSITAEGFDWKFA